MHSHFKAVFCRLAQVNLQAADNPDQGYGMDIKFDFAGAKTVTDVVVGGDLGTVVLCKVSRSKWCLTDVKGFILFAGKTRKSCSLELERMIARGKEEEAAAEAAAARSVAAALEFVDANGEASSGKRIDIHCTDEA